MGDISSNVLEISVSGFSGIATVALVIMLASVIIQAFSGFRKGFGRQSVKSLITIAAAAIAFIMINNISGSIFGSLSEISATEFLQQIEASSGSELPAEFKDIILGLDPIAFEYIIAILFGPFLAPFMFFGLFFALNAVGRIIYHIVTFIIRLRARSLASRLLGAIVGALHGFLFAAILLLPFTVVIDTVDVAARAEIEAAEDEAEKEKLKADHEAEIEPLLNNIIFKSVKTLGGDSVLNSFCTMKNGDEVFNAREEFFLLVKALSGNMDALSDMNMESFTEEDKAAIEKLIEYINKSDFISTIMASILNTAGKALAEDAVKENKSTSSILTAVADIFKTATKDTVAGDLGTTADIIFLLSEAGFTASGEIEPADALTKKDENGNTVLNKVLEIIDTNPRFAGLKKALVETSMAMLIENTPFTESTYTNIKNGFNAIITLDKPDPSDTAAYEEYTENVSEKINETLTTEGITLEPEVVDIMAEYVADNYGGSEEDISEEQFIDIMLNYYDSYLEYAESGNIPSL